jgi:hypothetical protein
MFDDYNTIRDKRGEEKIILKPHNNFSDVRRNAKKRTRGKERGGNFLLSQATAKVTSKL